MLRKETVEPATLELLEHIVKLPFCSDFRLVGGTALSLLYGHRKSIDLDFFTDKFFDKAALVENLENEFFPFQSSQNQSKAILQTFLKNIKVDFVYVRDQFKYPPQIIEGIPFADIREIAALKLNAIKGRGAKKDFWDIEKLLQNFELQELFKFYKDRYPYDDTFAVSRSIIYFEDAENEIDPIALENITWNRVKKNIIEAFKNYYKQ